MGVNLFSEDLALVPTCVTWPSVCHNPSGAVFVRHVVTREARILEDSLPLGLVSGLHNTDQGIHGLAQFKDFGGLGIARLAGFVAGNRGLQSGDGILHSIDVIASTGIAADGSSA